MGAFRKNGSLSEAIQFELSRETFVSCERLQKGKSLIDHARVGLLVDPKAVYKRYNGDVWSEYSAASHLHTHRKGYQASSKHKEAFAKPVYTGIVIKNGSFDTFRFDAREELKEIHERYNLNVYRLSKDSLIKEL